MENVITLESVNKSFKDFALRDVTFHVKKGFITGFIGPNGSGKTTTIKLLMNLISRDSGSIKLFGMDNEVNEKELKQKVGFVYAENYYYDHLTIQQMKRVIAPFYKKWNDKTFYNYLERFSLPKTKKIKQLSTGMKVKFSLAVALAHDPELIIMDEPTSGLDPVFRREILDILMEIIQDETKSVFFSSHITSDLEQIADYVTFIYNGQVVFNEMMDEIKEEYRIIRGGGDLLDSDIRKLFLSIRQTSIGFEGLIKSSQQVTQLFKDQAVIDKPSLEEIMVFTVKGDNHA